MKKAEITAPLALSFILIVSFISSIFEVASLKTALNYRRADAVRAVECVFAEYQKELLDEYNVFAVEGTYETGHYAESLLDKRLEYYGLVNSNNTIERIEFLTDDGATPYYEQTISYMEKKYGIEFVGDYLGMTDIWERQESDGKNYEKKEMQNRDDIDNLMKESESVLPEEGNPIFGINQLKKSPLLDIVMAEGMEISEKKLDLKEVCSKRRRNEGYGEFPEEKNKNGPVYELLFDQYILESFSTVADETGNVLDYEVEYILSGADSDRENLEKVVNRLVAIRFASNYGFLQGNLQKKAEAEALAFAMSAAIALPVATEALKQGILLAWAFGESLVDIRTLLMGNKVPLFKDNTSWQLSLSGLQKMGESNAVTGGMNSEEEGLDYEDYLRILLFLEDRETVALRSLDIIEQNLRKIRGLSHFNADYCLTKLEIKSQCSFRRGITYTFPTYFAYQ